MKSAESVRIPSIDLTESLHRLARKGHRRMDSNSSQRLAEVIQKKFGVALLTLQLENGETVVASPEND